MKTHLGKIITGGVCVAWLSVTALAASTSSTTKTDKAPAKTSSAAATTNAEKTPAERRQHIKDTVNATANRPITVTSEYRGNSTAHQRGAIDIRSKDLTPAARHQEAQQLSKTLGKNHTVVVEEVHRVPKGAQGPEAQVNTAYRDGQRGNTRVGPIKASDTHTHIQPEVPKKK